MNHRPMGSLLLSKAIVGVINYKTAEGLSPHTIDSHQEIISYISRLHNDPHCYSGITQPLSKNLFDTQSFVSTYSDIPWLNYNERSR
jgi:hypothetical protein